MSLASNMQRHFDKLDIYRCKRKENISERIEKKAMKIDAKVYPVEVDNTILQSEGMRYDDIIGIFTPFALRNSRDGEEPDRIIWNGREYIVIQVNNWLDMYDVKAQITNDSVGDADTGRWF